MKNQKWNTSWNDNKRKAKRRSRGNKANWGELMMALEPTYFSEGGYANAARLVVNQLENAQLFDEEKGAGIFNDYEKSLYETCVRNLNDPHSRSRNGKSKVFDTVTKPLKTALTEARDRLFKIGVNIDDYLS